MKSSPSNLSLAFAVLSAIGAASLWAQSTPVAYAPPARSTPLGSTIVDWDSLRFRASPVGLYCAVFDEPTPVLEKLEVHVTTLKPGMASHSPHHHAWEEMLLVKEGQLEVSMNGRKEEAGTGALVFIASNDAHNVTNVGATPATYYVINYVTDLVHTVRDQPAAQWAPAGMLSSRVVDCDGLPAPPDGGHRVAFDSPTVTFKRLESHVTVLDAGAGTPPKRRDPADELFFVKTGVLEVTLNGITSRVAPGSFYYVAPNDERTMRNIGTSTCSYQVIKVVCDKSPQAPAP